MLTFRIKRNLFTNENSVRDGFWYVAQGIIAWFYISDIFVEKGGQTREHAMLAKT